jgi:hypothetical protein
MTIVERIQGGQAGRKRKAKAEGGRGMSLSSKIIGAG